MNPGKKYNNIKPQNRLRIVFWEEGGKPISYLHIEKSESKTFLRVFREINKHDDWVWIQKLSKKLKIPRVSLTWAIARMAGTRYIDAQKNGVYERILNGPLILVKKGRMHGNVRRGQEPAYKHPPIYVRSARQRKM